MKKILIIDDNERFVNKIFYYLKENLDNCQIKKTYSGYEALNIIKDFKPNIVLLDLKIPDLDGINILENLSKEKEQNINFIIISSYSDYINKLTIEKNSLIRKIYIKPFKYENILSDIKYLLKEELEIKIRNLINKIIIRYKFYQDSIYYKMLIDAIFYCVLDAKLLYNLEKDLYIKISQNYEKYYTPTRIKWGIDKLIKSMVKYTDKNILKDDFMYDYPPTTKIFISKISRTLKKLLQNNINLEKEESIKI